MPTSSLHEAQLLLTRGMKPFEQRLHAQLIADVLRDFSAWRRELPAAAGTVTLDADRSPRSSGSTQSPWPLERRRQENLTARELLDYLVLRVRDALNTLQCLVVRYSDFCQAMSQASTEQDRQQLVFGYARDLGSTNRGARADERARSRWFSERAVADRYRRQRGEAEQRLTFALQCLGRVMQHVIGLVAERNRAAFWDRIRLERLLVSALTYDGDARVHVAALDALRLPLQAMGVTAASGLLSQSLLQLLLQIANDASRDVWLQTAALTTLAVATKDRGLPVLLARLAEPQPGDDLFVRRHSVQLLQQLLQEQQSWDAWPTQLVEDPSPFVRQQVAAALWTAPAGLAEPGLRKLALEDESAQVRAAALVESLRQVPERALPPILMALLANVLQQEQNEFVLRTAMHVAVSWYERAHSPLPTSPDSEEADEQISNGEFVARCYQEQVLPQLHRLQTNATSTPVRRWATESAEKIWMRSHPAARALYDRLQSRSRQLQPGKHCRVPRKWFRDLTPQQVGRTLAVLAQDDFGYDLESGVWGYRLVKQPVFRFRFWRAWHEFFRPATDKRQAFRHTIGRVSAATIRAPSRVLAELSQTKVPGEPLLIDGDGTWRPFLPLPDDFVSVLDRGLLWRRTTRFYSSEGITEVRAPRSLLRSLWATVHLNLRFAGYAAARNWQASSGASPRQYLQKMQRLGFEIRFQPYQDADRAPIADDSSVRQFFAGLLPLLAAPTVPWWDRLVRDYAYYFSSAFENSLIQLILFTAALALFFLAKHGYSNFRLRQARRAIPLSLGGWGTRGKSGTERLKAALLVTMGHGVVSKTTGCEAMFIQAHAFGEPLEIPLFRPYDKATIWEHARLLRLAADFKPSAFLWECMGLTPAYVDVLQRQWTQDDLATITNTYPDHEDLQGPSGFNVANTIAGFVPRQSHVITTEQQMRPVLQASCDRVGTTLHSVGWLESGLIPDDILDRFPYREHPDNIALVAAMADQLGCPYEVALRGMADSLVPDLGVLKTYPAARIRTRVIEFTNGMSANERFGTLGNWRRTGHDRQEPHQPVNVWVSTVVNNRADRVARSRVFASMLVEDLPADRHFLIGGNLKGLLGFIWEAWQQNESTWTLRDNPETWNRDQALAKLTRVAQQFRQPTEPAHLQNALRFMLQAVYAEDSSHRGESIVRESWNQPTLLEARLSAESIDAALVRDIVRHQQHLWRALQEVQALEAAIRQATRADIDSIEERFRRQLRVWFERKLVVIEDYDATGEEVVRDLVQETPPGYHNRVMGIQNIKGTGLDFIYRFQAWDACHQACELLNEPDESCILKGLQILNEMPLYGQLCQERVQQSLEQLETSPALGHPEIQSQREAVQQKLATSRQQTEQILVAGPASTGQQGGWLHSLHQMLEQFLDVSDSLRRRQTADLVYRDLRQERISRQEAVEQIRALNKRQKGGWLKLDRKPPQPTC